MITRKYHKIITTPTLLGKYADIEKILFFDIETTGLSSKNSFVYLISYGFFINEEFQLVQLFAENMQDELNILKEFEKALDGFLLLAQFNGNKFDIPYLLDRCKYHNIISGISSLEPFDIYLYLKAYKKLLNIPNCKLKTFEKLLNIIREDKIDGGEAINEYYNYVKNKDSSSLDNCLLHNYEDVIYLPLISQLIIFEQLSSSNDFRKEYSIVDNSFIIKIKCSSHLKFSINIELEDLEFTFKNNTAILKLNIKNNCIKSMYADYKNYVFLKDEDYAIEKNYARTLMLKGLKTCNIKNAYQWIPLESTEMNENSLNYIWKQNYDYLVEFLKKNKNE